MAGQPKTWVVDFDSDAVIDFEDVKSRGDRKAVFNVVQKLKDVGPDLPSPHMKSLKGRRTCSSCAQDRSLRGSADLRAAQAEVRGACGCGEEEGLRSGGGGSERPPQAIPLSDNRTIIVGTDGSF
jgi:hypothetical protein